VVLGCRAAEEVGRCFRELSAALNGLSGGVVGIEDGTVAPLPSCWPSADMGIRTRSIRDDIHPVRARREGGGANGRVMPFRALNARK
jgi:hypothetical protein